MTFDQKRKAVKAIRDFDPKLAQDREIPLSLMIVAFLTFIGTITVMFFVGYGIVKLLN